MGNYYVYILLDSSKPGEYIYNNYILRYEPFYVGKGTGKRIKDTLYDKSAFKYNKIQKLKREEIEIISLKLEENLTNDESILIEIELISLIGRRDLKLGCLVNTTDGGDGRVNSRPSEETKRKISENRKDKAIGWKHTEKILNLMSINQSGENNGFYGKQHTHTSRNNISLKNTGEDHPMYGKTHSVETIELLKESRKNVCNINIKNACQKFNKEVNQYSLDLKFIEQFESVKEASLKTNINESIISKCCRGDIINPTRYYFKYVNMEDNIKSNRYLIAEDTIFNYDKFSYKLIKRNITSAICEEVISKEIVSLRYKDYPALTFKDTNDSDFMELYLFLINYSTFKIDKENRIIYNDDIIIYYNKLFKSCELFLSKKEIFNRYTDDKVVINIFEDSWMNKKEIIKSRLLNKIGITPNKIFARKCEIREVVYKEKKDFIDKTHIQGDVRSRINLGLYYENELVSIMTFGGLRKNLGQKAKEGSFELLRFCNFLNTIVIGGASKLFKHFIKNYSPEHVISYADRCWSSNTGNLYEKLNFTRVNNKIIPNYFYIVDNIRKNRFGYRKDILVSLGYDIGMTEVAIQHTRGYYRIFDCGSFKYEYNKQ